MLRRRGNDRGLAEIVGTLMLVLIVVSAAVAFAAFVASYQAQLQASEAATHLQSLEALHVLSVDATSGGQVVTKNSGGTQTATNGTGAAGQPVGFYVMFAGPISFIPSSFNITAFACSAAPGTCTPAGLPYPPSSSAYRSGHWTIFFNASVTATQNDAIGFASATLTNGSAPGQTVVVKNTGAVQNASWGAGKAGQPVGFYALFAGTSSFVPSSFMITAFACSAAPGTCTPAGLPYPPSSSVYSSGDWTVFFNASVNATKNDAIGFASASLTYNSSPYPTQMTVTIASGDINPMWVQDLVVDGSPVVSYNATYLENGTTISVGVFHAAPPNDTNSTLFMPALQQVAITLELNDSGYPLFSFLLGEALPTANTALTLDFFTSRGNSFTAVYLPPTALADLTYIQSTNGTGATVETPALDGTHSFQSGQNATIINWDWSITDTTTAFTWTASGAEVELIGLVPSDNYIATLTVTNSVGLFTVSLPVTFPG